MIQKCKYIYHHVCIIQNVVTRELVTPNFQVMFFYFFFNKNFTYIYFWTKNKENEVEKFL